VTEERQYNPLCKCKECTGEGLGWITHATSELSKKRLDKSCRERELHLLEMNLLDPCQRIYLGIKP
jgi:hypothetical protein